MPGALSLLRDQLDRTLSRLRAGLSPWQVAAALVLLAVCDYTYRKTGVSFLPGAPLDETAHLMTAVLILGALPREVRERFLGPALLASVAIDIDHVPADLGTDVLTSGTPRPYTHSLLTIVLLIAAAALFARRRDLLAGLALGLAIHLFRDLSESMAGVSLLWPLTYRVFSIPHRVYSVLVGITAGICAIKLILAANGRMLGPWPGMMRGSSSRHRRAFPRRPGSRRAS
jgi:inner membrane protein